MRKFAFVGYLIQEPYWRTWPNREGYRVATIEREFHPIFNKHQWDDVRGVINPTRFLTRFPRLEKLPLEPHQCRSVLHKQSPGWVVSGYALPLDFVGRRTITSTDKKESLLEFGYAAKMERDDDGLKLLGYEVVDEDDLFSSILNNCGYTVERVREMAGALNEYSLLPSVADAERFEDAIRINIENPRIAPDHNRGVSLQVWGAP